MEIGSYRSQKTKIQVAQPQTGSMGMGKSPVVFETNTSTKITWSEPKGWTFTAGTGMRLVSFSLPAQDNKAELAGDGSIVVLGPGAGSLAANINRWRGQIELKSLSPMKIKKEKQIIKSKLGEISYYFLTNQKNNKAVLGAVLSDDKKTLFIKVMGPMSTLERHQTRFKAFIKGLHESK